jgi:hypothetical protein
MFIFCTGQFQQMHPPLTANRLLFEGNSFAVIISMQVTR